MPSISQISVETQDRVAQNGQKAYVNDKDYEDTLINSKGQVKAVKTATLLNIQPNGVTRLVIDGYTVSFTDDGTPSDTDSAAGLVAAINADPLVRGRVSAANVGAVITLTALTPGVDFTLTSPDGTVTPAVVTAAAVAELVPFGRFLVKTDWDPQKLGKLGGLPTGLTAQVDTYLMVYDSGVLVNVKIAINGQEYTASHLMATDLATSGAALAAAINLAVPPNTVLASFNTATLTFESSMWFGTGADTAAFTKTSNNSSLNDINKAFFGISEFGYTEAVSYLGVLGYPANSSIAAMVRGHIWVTVSEVIVENDPVYVELATGKPFKTYAAGRALMEKRKAIFKRYDAASSLALIYCNALDQ